MDYEIRVVNVPSYLRVVFMISAADFGVAILVWHNIHRSYIC